MEIAWLFLFVYLTERLFHPLDAQGCMAQWRPVGALSE